MGLGQQKTLGGMDQIHTQVQTMVFKTGGGWRLRGGFLVEEAGVEIRT